MSLVIGDNLAWLEEGFGFQGATKASVLHKFLEKHKEQQKMEVTNDLLW